MSLLKEYLKSLEEEPEELRLAVTPEDFEDMDQMDDTLTEVLGYSPLTYFSRLDMEDRLEEIEEISDEDDKINEIKEKKEDLIDEALNRLKKDLPEASREYIDEVIDERYHLAIFE